MPRRGVPGQPGVPPPPAPACSSNTSPTASKSLWAPAKLRWQRWWRLCLAVLALGPRPSRWVLMGCLLGAQLSPVQLGAADWLLPACLPACCLSHSLARAAMLEYALVPAVAVTCTSILCCVAGRGSLTVGPPRPLGSSLWDGGSGSTHRGGGGSGPGQAHGGHVSAACGLRCLHACMPLRRCGLAAVC